MTSTDFRPSRRTLVRGAAWSVPVISIAAAAPAFAASPCSVRSNAYRLDWGQSATAWVVSKTDPDGVHTGTATIAGPTNSTPVVVTFASTMTRPANSARRAPENLTVSTDTNIGNLGANEQALNIAHDIGIRSGRTTYRQDIQISFDRAVTGLNFTVTDIDTQESQQTDRVWSDRVEFNPNVTSFNFPTGSEVIGSGKTQNENNNANGPFRRTATGNVGNTADNSGNVNVTYTSLAANSPITLTFWTSTAAGNQRIFLSDFTFTASTCK